MANTVPQFTSPVGRLLSGSVGEQEATNDSNGVQKLKDGVPMFHHRVTVAFPKGRENHWGETPWGAAIMAVGYEAFPGGQCNKPDFAWKVLDGDSTIPNARGKIPAQQVGHAGHWVVTFKTNFAPQAVNANGTQPVPANQFYRGCYVQVHATLAGNKSTQSPGVYLNHDIVAFAGHGEQINTGADASECGFGQDPLPQGASQTPIGGMAQGPQGGPAQGYPQQGPQGGPAQPYYGAMQNNR